MRSATLRYAWLAIIGLVIVAALTAAWVTLSHAFFAVAAALAGVTVLISVTVRDGWRQARAESLAEHAEAPDADGASALTGPGQRRASLIPAAVTVSGSGARPPDQARRSRDWRPGPQKVARPARSWRGGKGRSRQEPALRADATVSFGPARQAAGIDELLAALDRDLIGLVPVKKKMEEIGSLLLIDQTRQRFGLNAPRPNLHMCFTGAPGTGKTTVATMMADLLHQLGFLETNNLVHAMRNDLVGEYVGHTAPKTRKILNRAMGGVLFIDEAYTLFRGEDSKDYGQECLDILMQVMENNRDKLVVILAGYKEPMDRFFRSNPGMSSRVAHQLHFDGYTISELLAIGDLMLSQSSYYLSPQAQAAFRDLLLTQMTQPGFANARSVRNTLEGARLRHAHRLAANPARQWTKDDLMRLEPPDIAQQRAGIQPA